MSVTSGEGEECLDQVLMEQIRDGQRDSLRRLLEKYWSPLVGYSSGIVGGRDDAMDVVQNVFIRIWQKRADWTAKGSASAYLYRITRNLSLNALRDRRTKASADETGGITLANFRQVRDPHDQLRASSLREQVETAIDSLPERRREVFILSRFQGLTHREIAETMGISPQTVANQMSAALVELRRQLAHHLEDR